jgi:hypothetical protein
MLQRLRDLLGQLGMLFGEFGLKGIEHPAHIHVSRLVQLSGKRS